MILHQKNLQNILPIELDSVTLIQADLKYTQDLMQSYTPIVSKFMFSKILTNEDEATARIKKYIKKNQQGLDFHTFVIDKNNHKFLGYAAIEDIDTKEPMISLWLRESAQGKGFGKQLAHSLLMIAKENLEFNFISYPTDIKNLGSLAIAKSLGGQVGASYGLLTENGNDLDVVEYRMVK